MTLPNHVATRAAAAPTSPEAALPPAAISMLIEQAAASILVADMRAPDLPLVYVNAAFEQVTGYGRAEAIGKNCRYLQGSDREQPEIGVIRRALEAGEAVSVTLRNYRRDGTMFWNRLRLTPVRDELGISHYVGSMRDVTQDVLTAGRLADAIQSDRLTSTLSRDGFMEAFGGLSADRMTLLIKVDVARFNEVNGGYGYDVGDALLIEIARRLRGCEPDLVGRIGSDEFAVAFALKSREDAAASVSALIPVLEARYFVSGADLQIRVASGYVVGEAGADPLVLMRQCGAALSRCKASLLRRPCEFDLHREQQLRRRLRLTAELQQAVAGDEFEYHFQPKVELQTGEVVGAEALLRWRHELFGLQPPSRFIALAEETGVILDIGGQGLPKIAEFAVEVNRGRPRPLNFAVNVSVVEFTHRDIVQFVSEVMERSGACPAWFTLELTESLMVEDSPQLLKVFERLRSLGVGLSIDDFGAGYSSLRYVDRLPISEIKIDRSFVSDLDGSPAKRVIAQSVINIAQSLGLSVVAEGVERQVVADILRDMGCRLGQGYLFSPSVPGDIFTCIAGKGLPAPPASASS